MSWPLQCPAEARGKGWVGASISVQEQGSGQGTALPLFSLLEESQGNEGLVVQS